MTLLYMNVDVFCMSLRMRARWGIWTLSSRHRRGRTSVCAHAS